MVDLSLFNSFAPSNNVAKRNGNNAVIYTRVSDSTQEDNTSLESQKKYSEDFATRRGLTVIEYFGGTYESAKTDDRKEFNKMLAYIKRNKKVNYIIVYSYERFSRSGIKGAQIANDLLQDYNVMTLAVRQEIDPSTPAGQFQQSIFFLFSQMDNEMRRDKTVTGTREILRKGYYPHCLPKGYSNLMKGSRAVDQRIVINEEGEFIRKAFLWKANEAMRNITIIQKLNHIGYALNEKRLTSILKNPFYCGIITSRMIPGEIIIGRHEPLISHELFLKANEIITTRSNHPVTHKQKDNNLPLKRFMKCVCGRSMTGYLVKKKRLYYYKCSAKSCCTNKSAKELHNQFRILMNLKMNVHIQLLVEEGIKTIYSKVFKEGMNEKRLLKTRKNDLLRKIERIEERFAIGEINEQLFQKFHNRFKNELSEIVKEKVPISASQLTVKNCLDFAVKICLNPLELWDNGSIDQRTRLQLLLFPNGIQYDKKTLCLNPLKTSDFFQPEIPLFAEVNSTFENQKKAPFPHFTFEQLDCSLKAINDKFTFTYIIERPGFGHYSKAMYQYVIRFLEDYCILVISAYFTSQAKMAIE